jgi:hypothetical protein
MADKLGYAEKSLPPFFCGHAQQYENQPDFQLNSRWLVEAREAPMSSMTEPSFSPDSFIWTFAHKRQLT